SRCRIGSQRRRSRLPGKSSSRPIEESVRESADPAPVNRRGLCLASRPPDTSGEPPHPSYASLRGLDWFIFFLADVQTGFGPFVAVYLTSQKWTQVEIGFVLSIGGVIALIGQMPGGAIVDAMRSTRLVAGAAIMTIACCALGYAAW